MSRGQAVPLAAPEGNGLISFGLIGLVGKAPILDATSPWVRINTGTKSFTFGSVDFTARKQAQTTQLVVDIQISTDGGNTFVTTLQGYSLILPVQVYRATIQTPAWRVTDARDGDLLRLDVTQADMHVGDVRIDLHEKS